MIVEAVLSATADAFDAMRSTLENSPDNPAHRLMKLAGETANIWERTGPPGQPKQYFSVVVDSAVLELRGTLFPSATVLGVWRCDGFELGVEPVFDGDGELVGTRGSPTYPRNDAELLLAQPPDDVTGLPRVTLQQIHRLAGWADRRYDVHV